MSVLAYLLWRRELSRMREKSLAGFLQPGSGRTAWVRARAQLANITEVGWALKNGFLAIVAAPFALLLLVMAAIPGDTKPKDRLFCASLGVFFAACSWFLGHAARQSWRRIQSNKVRASQRNSE